MKNIIIALSAILGIFCDALGQQKTEIHGQKYTVVNRTIVALEETEKKIIRFTEGEGGGVAWIDDATFAEGTIEFDARGRDEFQRSFVGIAFHGVDYKSYEAVYFRPFNFNVADKARNAHAVQYIFEPYFTWFVLRKLRYDEFEAPIGIPTISKTDWFHAKIEIRNGRIRAFVNGSEKPALDVAALNDEGKMGNKIGFWVGGGAVSDFANLKISK
ncbi:MAG: hypothetical protein EAZ67_14095 [Cytophagales bacterium]|nr:MAG: hypothetical protein EAZ67_14095 [Cytophagales bacterium]